MNGPRRIRFTADDPYGGWKKGEAGWELGLESPHAPAEDMVPVWLIRLARSGEVYSLTDPWGRGLIEFAEEAGAS